MSQGSYLTARNLSELGDEYRALLGGSISDNLGLSHNGHLKQQNYLWTRVLSMQHFEVSGCYANKLEDDLQEAQEELASLGIDHAEPCELIFNPKDDELPKDAHDIEPYRLSAQELEALGEQVADLRVLVKARVCALKAVGHVDSVPQVPLQPEQAEVNALAVIRNKKLLAKEEERIELLEGLASHKYRKRHYNELSANDIVGIAHAYFVEHRQRKDIAE